MPSITLPDGLIREYPGAVTGLQIAESIGAGLAKAALAIVVDGEEWDLTRPIEKDAAIRILTGKDAEGLELIRHDSAHLMAEAVKELFPETQVTIGPAIENGFYYDFARAKPFTTEDLAVIENRMREIVARNEAVTREVWKRDDAVSFFKASAKNTRRKSSPPSRRMKIFRSTARANSSTSAAGRMRLPPVKWAPRSSC